MKAQIKPDLNEAQRFLDFLEKGGLFWFQTALEPKPDDGKAHPRVLQGTLDKVGDQLVKLNQGGSAVWVQINAGTGRTNRDINRIRSYFVDQDHGSTDLLLNSAIPLTSLSKAVLASFTATGWQKTRLLSSTPPACTCWQTNSTVTTMFATWLVSCACPAFYFHLKGDPFMSRIAKIREGL